MPPVAAAPKIAWVYVRVSDEGQEANHSPETQEAKCRELAAKLGYDVARVGYEQGSARSMRQRSVWKSFHRAIRAGAMQAVFVYSISRLHRNFVNAMEMMGAAKRAGVEIVSVTEHNDGGKMGRVMQYMAALMAEWESDTIAERTLDGNRTRAAVKGMPLVGRTPPYGYRWKVAMDTSAVSGAARERKVALVEDAVTGPRMRAIWDYLDNPLATLGQCADWLNHVQRWPSPQGKLWRKSTLRGLLYKPLYWGEHTAFATVTTDVRETDAQGNTEVVRRPRQREASDVVKLPPTAAPALVSREQAMRVLSHLRRRREHPDSDARRQDKRATQLNRQHFLLTGGLIRCGHTFADGSVCGGTLSPRRRNGRNAFYVCSGGASQPRGHTERHYLSILASDAEDFAMHSTLRVLLNPGEAGASVRRIGERRDESASGLETARAELAGAEARVDTLKKLASYLTEAEMADFAEQVRAAKAERERWTARVQALSEADTTVATLEEALHRAIRQASEASAISVQTAMDITKVLWVSREEKRRILFSLGAFVSVADGGQRDAEARLSYHLPLERDGADMAESVSLRKGLRPVAVSASQASKTPTMSCSA